MSNPLDAAKGFLGGLQQKAGEVAEGLKDKVEDMVGEENVKKVTDVLNTDVGSAAKNALDKAEDAVEKVTGIDLDGKPGA
jgi:S-ribosylhomocysteine lyase LuxS involved in autoinducer biosynthesis